MSYTVEDYKLDLERIAVDKEVPPCPNCPDKIIARCMKTGKECKRFVLFTEEGDGTHFNYRVYHREYYRRHREKLLEQKRRKFGWTKKYNSKFSKVA